MSFCTIYIQIENMYNLILYFSMIYILSHGIDNVFDNAN